MRRRRVGEASVLPPSRNSTPLFQLPVSYHPRVQRSDQNNFTSHILVFGELLPAHIPGQEDCQLSQLQNQLQPGFNSHRSLQRGQLLLQIVGVHGCGCQDYYPRQIWRKTTGAGVMLLLMVKMGRFFYDLPNAVLAGIVLSNVVPYLETIYNLPSLWRRDQYDCVVWMVTFSSAILLGLDIGLLISLVFAFFIITVRSHRTKILLLGQIPNTNIYRNISDYREVVLIPGVKIFQCCNSITFVNVYKLKHKLLKEINMVRVPLKEEEIFTLFNNDGNISLSNNKICRCFCDCEELEPEPRIVYTERFENKQEHDSSSINLIRCSYLGSRDTSQSASEVQVPYTVSSTSQRIPGQGYEDTEKVWLSNNPSRNSSAVPEAVESLAQSRSITLPYSDPGAQISTHTIILDFSMVQYVDSRALVTLRQMFNAFHNANILVLIAGCHSSVLKSFEKNDFFDDGITKAQLFLSLHDAVLFALARRFSDASELSLDETEMVLQETYSESDKNGKQSHKNAGVTEVPQLISPNFIKTQEPVDEVSDFDLELEPMMDSDQGILGLSLDLDLDLDGESELGSEFPAESEVEPEPDLEPDSRTEPEVDDEPEPEHRPQPRSRIRSQSPWRNYRTAYRFGASSPQSQTASSERRQPHTHSDSIQWASDEEN